MLFRTNTGELIEIKKYDFTNDKLYYEKIINIKTPLLPFSKSNASLVKTNPFMSLTNLSK